MRNQKFLILCMAVVILLSSCVLSGVLAEDNRPVFVLSDHTVSAGEEFTVSISIRNFVNVQGFVIKFSYDTGIFSISDERDLAFAAEIKEGFMTFSPTLNSQAGTVAFLATNSTLNPPLPNAAALTVATVKIKVSGQAQAGTYPLTLFGSSLSAGMPGEDSKDTPVSLQNGSITVREGVVNPGPDPTPTPMPTASTKPDVSFLDVSDTHWAKPYIIPLANQGIINGTGDGYFHPERNITREEFTKLIVSAFDLYDASASCDMDDVPKDSWYYPYIASAKKCGIIQGIGDGQFGVGTNITRQDMAVLSYRAAQYKGIVLKHINEPQAFIDSEDIADYAKASVYSMQTGGIISGMGEGAFSPYGLATRAQASKIIFLLKA